MNVAYSCKIVPKPKRELLCFCFLCFQYLVMSLYTVVKNYQ